VSIVTFTYNYILAQAFSVVSIIVFSVFLSNKNTNPIICSLILNDKGGIQLLSGSTSQSSNILTTIELPPIYYQLQASSRFSFIGCWLVMTPDYSKSTPQQDISKVFPKQLFIFRDSVSEQDFSRIANVIKQL